MKKTSKNLTIINCIFCISVVVANVVTCKVVDTGLSLFGSPILLPGAALTYAFTFLCTDIIGEVWGKKEANQAVKHGLICQLFAMAMILITQYLPTNNSEIQDAYYKLLGQTPVFVVGSLVAYYCSQSWDVWIFHKIRNRFIDRGDLTRYKWIWNNASTITSQFIDTVIFITISFGIGLGWFWNMENGVTVVLLMMLGQYLLKAILALLDTPFFYYFTKQD